jgi:hypothetical protein
VRAAAVCFVLLAAAAAVADDDPDLPVVSGFVPKNAPSDFGLRLVRVKTSSWSGWEDRSDYADLSVHPGGTFRFAGVLPGRYELVAEGGGLETSTRALDVFGDVANLEVCPVTTPKRADATFVGTVTLGFEGDMKRCRVSIDGVPAALFPDGAIRCAALHAGPAWATIDYRDDLVGRRADQRQLIVRHLPLTLVAGENHADLRLEPDEDVRLALHAHPPRSRIEARLTDLDPGPWEHGRTEGVAFDSDADGTPRAWRWILWPPDAYTFEQVGRDLPLGGLARGAHRFRIEADGYETVERQFDVDGATRVDVEMKPFAGTYFVPDAGGGEHWIVEERDGSGAWTPVATRDLRMLWAGHEDPPPTRMFLAQGRHTLRAVRPDAPPSAPVDVDAAGDRAVRAVAFKFPAGHTLIASLTTVSDRDVGGFVGYCFARVGERWERRRTQDVVIETHFRIAGLAPGLYRLATDETGARVLAEFEMKDEDAERTFIFRAR